MAYIEFEGPDGVGGRIVTRKTMPDEALIAVVSAVTEFENYVGDQPGLYVIDRAIKQWRTDVLNHEERKRAKISKVQIEEALAPLEMITTTINGVQV